MAENSQSFDELSFREAMHELDRVVNALESNTLELEESMVQFERAIGLIANVQARLNNAQQKIDVLMGELELDTSDEERDTTLS